MHLGLRSVESDPNLMELSGFNVVHKTFGIVYQLLSHQRCSLQPVQVIFHTLLDAIRSLSVQI